MKSSRLSRSHPAIPAFAIAAAVSAALVGARHQGWLERLELVAFDHFVGRIVPDDEARPRIAVVEVTEQDIQNLESYPIPDGYLAQAIEVILDSGARAVGIDIYRDIPVPPGTEQLDATLTGRPRVIVPSKFADSGGYNVAPPKVLEGSEQVGFNNMIVDSDGIVRRGLLYMEDGAGEVGVSMSFRLAMLYLGDENIWPEADPDDENAVKIGAHGIPPLVPDFGGYNAADTGGYQYALDYRNAPDAIPVTNLSDVLAGKSEPELFRDRIVMIGVAAESLTDTLMIPFGAEAAAGRNIPGAELHARMADQIVRMAVDVTAPLRTPAPWQETAMVVVCGALATTLVLLVPSGAAMALVGFGGLVGLWCVGWFGLVAGWWIPVVPPALCWVGSLTIVAGWSRSRERAERAEIMDLFGRHVTESVAKDVWEHRDEYLEGGRPKPFRATATMLFIDIRGYTGNVEKMDPAELMEWIDAFLGGMAQEVLDCGGMVEDYFGDGMMACFGIPIPAKDAAGIRADATAAARSAVGMERALRRLNEEWATEGRPAVGIRVGICTGQVVVGSMGSSNRLKYGVVGDAVVTAQRLESLGLDIIEHDFDVQPARILISESTQAQLDPSFLTDRIGELNLKGKNEPVTVFRVLGRAIEDVEASSEEMGALGGPKS